MPAIVNINGRVVDQEHAVISVFDHGFLYGEGVYETWRTYNGQPFLFDRHMRRLRNSAGMLALPVPLTNDQVDDRCRETMAAGGLGAATGTEAYVRLLLTRGIGELSYDPALCPAPSMVIIVKPHVAPAPEIYERGVKVAIVPIIRNHPGTVNPLIKSNNLLNNALAMQEAFRRGADEGVMRNYRGELAECTQSNLFIVRNGTAVTPPIDAGLLPGITREFVFEIGPATDLPGVPVPVEEAVLHDADLFGAEEAFLTSSTREIVPIVQVDDRPIGSRVPGAITRRLLERFRARAHTLTRGLSRRSCGQAAESSEKA